MKSIDTVAERQEGPVDVGALDHPDAAVAGA